MSIVSIKLLHKTTSVYVAFLDASKAFDKINHWILFKNLIAMRVPNLISSKKAVLLVSNIQVNVYKMGTTFSGTFHVTNDVR